MVEMSEMSDDVTRYCQLHDDDEKVIAVLRMASQSVAGTPLITDLCDECANAHITAWPMFGVPPGTELVWLEDAPAVRKQVDDVLDELAANDRMPDAWSGGE